MTSPDLGFRPSIAIYGTGAIGSVFAAYLTRAGADVTVIGREPSIGQVRERGVSLRGPAGEIHCKVRTAAETVHVGPVDYLILAVKQPALPRIAASLAPLIGPHTVVLPAVNGVPWWLLPRLNYPTTLELPFLDPEGDLGRVIPASQILGIVVYIAAQSDAPGQVVQGPRDNMIVGEPDGGASDRATRFAQLISRSGLVCPVSTDIRRDIWIKASGNAVFNPLSVLSEATMQDMVQDPHIARLIVRALSEIFALGEQLGINVGMTAQERYEDARKSGPVRTSMLQDALAGRPLEIDALLGSMVALGEQTHLPMPFTEAIWGLVRRLDISRRQRRSEEG